MNEFQIAKILHPGSLSTNLGKALSLNVETKYLIRKYIILCIDDLR